MTVDLRPAVITDPRLRHRAESVARVSGQRLEIVIAIVAAVESWCLTDLDYGLGAFDEQLAWWIASMSATSRERQIRHEVPRLRPELTTAQVESLAAAVTEYVSGAARGDREYLWGTGRS
ncbi:hypothetical protein AB2L57_10810 [Microbacterium sp. HA-8]|uniref:hypothetical protein n=1 Tax=Microbacterium sp. HA-8 TaxID=3234200 RepID=UPI0038F7F295